MSDMTTDGLSAPEALIEKAWKQLADAHNIHSARRWTQTELYALFATGVQTGWDAATEKK